MTPKEAIETIKIAIAEVEWNYPINYAVAFETAIEALEKQIPKKVTHEATLLRCCTCPTCKNVVDKFEKWGESTVRITYNHCQICGQALDWSDGERKENEN